jgi:hypothetical protein
VKDPAHWTRHVMRCEWYVGCGARHVRRSRGSEESARHSKGKEKVMRKPVYCWLSAVLFGVVLASCSGAPKENASTNQNAAATMESNKAAEAPIARGEAAELKVSLTVEAVDVEKRVITLKGPQGNEGTYEVGDQVKRLSEIKAGDKVNAEYKVAAVAELREPTEEEKSSPLTAVSTGERGTSDQPPAAGIARAVRAVTTIVALDAPNQSFTVQGPMEGIVTVHVDDPTVFSHLQVGQTIVVTFAETLVLSVQPGAKARS